MAFSFFKKSEKKEPVQTGPHYYDLKVKDIVQETRDAITIVFEQPSAKILYKAGQFLTLMAILSINLGLFNLLPIPILDGGHLMFFTLEALRRRPLSQRAREIASAIGLIIILLLLLIALRNDVMRLWMD